MDILFCFFYVMKNNIWHIIFQAGCPLSDQIETVNSCPQTAAEWKEAATRKNCKTTSHNCYSLDYHCVINAWMNETIEVCAPNVVIVGNV